MKTRIALLIFFSALFIQGKKPADYSKVLPGVIKVNDHLYYDKTEITNISWLEYVSWNEKVHGMGSAEHLASFPDTNVWVQKGAYNKPYVRYYLSHPAYQNYPVVGVTWDQANDYCAWRTERVKEWAQANKKSDKLPAYFNYRLPSFEEYMLMYGELCDLPNQIGEEGKKAYRGMIRYNMKRDQKDFMGVAGQVNDNADITAPVLSYWPNASGVWNIKGNVNEWLLEENTYIGGGWSTPMESDVSIPLQLDSTSAAVGFRCVCEVSEESL